MATGVLGGALALLGMGLILKRATRLLSYGNSSGATGLLFVSSFVGAQFSAAVYSNAALWVLAAVVAVAVIEKEPSATRIRPTYRVPNARNT